MYHRLIFLAVKKIKELLRGRYLLCSEHYKVGEIAKILIFTKAYFIISFIHYSNEV